jgi:hypothetical protein
VPAILLHCRLVVVLGLALGLVGARADADCDFEHPRKAQQFRTNLIQAFIVPAALA